MNARVLIWIVVALLLVYGGWQLYRALRGRAAVADAAPAPASAGADDVADEDFDYAPLPAADATRPAAAAAERAAAGDADPFRFQLELQRLRREVSGLRAALDVQQQEIGALHDALRSLQLPPAAAHAHAHVEQNPSPEYSEALAFARRGMPVEAIAARCGITVAEAELVRALAARDDGGGAR